MFWEEGTGLQLRVEGRLVVLFHGKIIYAGKDDILDVSKSLAAATLRCTSECYLIDGKSSPR